MLLHSVLVRKGKILQLHSSVSVSHFRTISTLIHIIPFFAPPPPQRHKDAITAAKEDSRRVSLESELAVDREEAIRLFRSNLPPEGADETFLPEERKLEILTEEVGIARKLRVKQFLEKLENDRLKLLQDIVAGD